MNLQFNITIDEKKAMINGEKYDLVLTSAMQALSSIICEHIEHTKHKLTGTFNKNVFWPDELRFIIEWTMAKRYHIEPTQHLFDRLHEYRLPTNCYKAMMYGEVIEVEVECGVVKKIVTRLPDRNHTNEDLCAAIKLSKNEFGTNIAKVITIWVNDRKDKHFTLKKEQYKQSL